MKKVQTTVRVLTQAGVRSTVVAPVTQAPKRLVGACACPPQQNR
jgi:hypothetical protein